MSRRSRLESVKGPLPHYVAQYEVGKVVAKGAGGLLSAFRDGLRTSAQTQSQSSGRVQTPTSGTGQVRGGAGRPGRGRVGPKSQGGLLGQLLEGIRVGSKVESGGGRAPNRGVESGRPRAKALGRNR